MGQAEDRLAATLFVAAITELELAAVLACERASDREAEARAVGLAGDTGLEHAPTQIIGEPWASIADDDLCGRAGARPALASESSETCERSSSSMLDPEGATSSAF